MDYSSNARPRISPARKKWPPRAISLVSICPNQTNDWLGNGVIRKTLEFILWLRLFKTLNTRYSFTADVIGHLMLSLLGKGDLSSYCCWNCHRIPFSFSETVFIPLSHRGRLFLRMMCRFPRCWATGLFLDSTTLSEFPTRK